MSDGREEHGEALGEDRPVPDGARWNCDMCGLPLFAYYTPAHWHHRFHPRDGLDNECIEAIGLRLREVGRRLDALEKRGVNPLPVVLMADFNAVEGGNIDLEAKHPVHDIDLASLERTGQPVVFTDYDIAYFGRLRFDPETTGHWWALIDWDREVPPPPLPRHGSSPASG